MCVPLESVKSLILSPDIGGVSVERLVCGLELGDLSCEVPATKGNPPAEGGSKEQTLKSGQLFRVQVFSLVAGSFWPG